MRGNHALGEAAILAGCQCYFGYPITPQNELTEYMAENMHRVPDGVFIQSESEIAAINMVLGASVTGKRAMTSSSPVARRSCWLAREKQLAASFRAEGHGGGGGLGHLEYFCW